LVFVIFLEHFQCGDVRANARPVRLHDRTDQLIGLMAQFEHIVNTTNTIGTTTAEGHEPDEFALAWSDWPQWAFGEF